MERPKNCSITWLNDPWGLLKNVWPRFALKNSENSEQTWIFSPSHNFFFTSVFSSTFCHLRNILFKLRISKTNHGQTYMDHSVRTWNKCPFQVYFAILPLIQQLIQDKYFLHHFKVEICQPLKIPSSALSFSRKDWCLIFVQVEFGLKYLFWERNHKHTFAGISFASSQFKSWFGWRLEPLKFLVEEKCLKERLFFFCPKLLKKVIGIAVHCESGSMMTLSNFTLQNRFFC